MKKVTVFLFTALLLICILTAIPVAHAYTEGGSVWDFVQENWLIMTITSIIVTIIAGFIMLSMHNSANKQLAAQRYLTEGGYYKVLDKQEVFERTYETVQRGYYKQKTSSNGGSVKPKK